MAKPSREALKLQVAELDDRLDHANGLIAAIVGKKIVTAAGLDTFLNGYSLWDYNISDSYSTSDSDRRPTTTWIRFLADLNPSYNNRARLAALTQTDQFRAVSAAIIGADSDGLVKVQARGDGNDVREASLTFSRPADPVAITVKDLIDVASLETFFCEGGIVASPDPGFSIPAFLN